MRRSARAVLASILGTALAASAVAGPAGGTAPDDFTVRLEGALNLPDGDGHNDAADIVVTAAEQLAVDIDLLDTDGTVVRAIGAALELTDPELDGTWTITRPIEVAGLSAGEYTIRASDAGEPTMVTESALTVEPRAGAELSLERSAASVYPHQDGYRDSVVFTTRVTSPTSAALPVTGTVTITSGTTTVQSWPVSTSSAQSFTWDGKVDGVLVAGRYTVTSAVTTADGAILTDSTAVYAGTTRAKGIALTRDGGIAPARDGYRDEVALTVSISTSIGQTMPVIGRVKVLRDGKTVKTWELTDSATRTVVWDGRVDGKLLPGAYTVTAIARGPESTVRRTSIPLTVFGKSLVTIGGTVADGETVNARLTDPGWGGAPAPVSTQWMLDGTDIVGATAPELAVTPAMVGRQLSVRVETTVLGVSRVGTSELTTVHPGAASEAGLRNKLDALIRTLPGDYTLKIRELDNGRRSLSIGGRIDREPASAIKIFIAYAVYKRIDEGVLSYSSKVSSGLTVEQCLRAMIEPSDNLCTVELRHKVGTGYLNDLIDAGGYTDTHFWYSGGKTKLTSATDLTDLIARLGVGNLLSKDSTERFLHLLKTQVWRVGIPRGLPYDVPQASKPGSLWTPGGMVQTDVAFVWGKQSRYAIAVMGYNGADTASIMKISRLVYTHLQGDFTTAFGYQDQQMISNAKVTLRSGAGSTAKVLGSYPAGTAVQVIDSIRNWYYVKVGGKKGYMLNTALVLRHPVG